MKSYFFLALCFLCGCKSPSEEIKICLDLIPAPLSLDAKQDFSEIKKIVISSQNSELLEPALPWIRSWSLHIQKDSKNPNSFFRQDSLLKNGEYHLKIEKEELNLEYGDTTGLTNGLSTISQLLLLNEGKLPLIKIKDKPAFSYRGMHLDVARHMFSVAEVKKYIDYLALYKFNKFHWHLTEDQGWRIEIKQYPKLQSIAAYREETLIGHYNDHPQKFDGERYGGYYTQEEVKNIIQYAEARGIEVIPEIDIPGHSLALLSAYPELGCKDKEYKAATKWGVFPDVLCPKEETFIFLENVFTEIIELFPSKYIHIGGDECPKDQWKESALCQSIMKKENLKDEMELQSYFIQRIEKFINSKGKQIIGWDEILEGGLAPNATVMSWRGIEGGIEAAYDGHDVVMTPTSHCYYDYYQSQNEGEPLAIGGYTPYQKVYDWSPVPEELEAEYHKYILGGQGNIWTEYMKTFDQVEYMALTRMMTLSEVLWGKHSSTLDTFNNSLFSHTSYWESQNVNIANHLLDITSDIKVDSKKGVSVTPKTANRKARILYKSPTAKEYAEVDESVKLNERGTYSFYSEIEGKKGKAHEVIYFPHLANNAKIELKHQPAERYSGNGAQSLINGVTGPDHRYGGSEWLGFSGKDFDANIIFNKEEKLNLISMRFFKGEGQWIYLPSEIMVYKVKADGSEELLAQQKGVKATDKIASEELKFPSTYVSKLRIIAKNFGKIPEGRQGSGHASWLFVDEIKIR